MVNEVQSSITFSHNIRKALHETTPPQDERKIAQHTDSLRDRLGHTLIVRTLVLFVLNIKVSAVDQSFGWDMAAGKVTSTVT